MSVLMKEALKTAQSTIERINSGAMVSFSQNYEDVILNRFFASKSEGFYVDIGAFHPTRNSVTKHFYDKGWRGINVDLDATNIAHFKEERLRDTNVCRAIGESNEHHTFHVIPGSSRSTQLSELAESYRERGIDVKQQELKTQTLDSLINEFNVEAIDFLKIDVEGAEASVLKGLDLSVHRPSVILAEATYPETTRPTFHDWEPLLLAKDYQFVYFDGLNRFYVKAELEFEPDIFDVPPNFFDDFLRADNVQLAQAIIELLKGD